MRKIIFDLKQQLNKDFIHLDNEGDNKEINDDINLSNNKGNKYNKDEMFEYINNIMANEYYGLGLHTSHGENLIDNLDNILKHGLEIDENKKILSTVSSFGIHKKIKSEYLKEDIISYSYGRTDELKQNLVILAPSIIESSKGEKVFLGFPQYDTTCAGNDFRISSVLDVACTSENKKEKIPKEFVLGYYTNINDEINFTKNDGYYKNLSEQEKDEFFDVIKNNIKGKYKLISDAVISNDIEILEKLALEEKNEITKKIKKETRNNILKRGLNHQLASTLSSSNVKMHQDDSAITALFYLENKERKMENEKEILNTGDKKRKLLLNLYKDQEINLKDIAKPEEYLKHNIKQKNNFEERER